MRYWLLFMAAVWFCTSSALGFELPDTTSGRTDLYKYQSLGVAQRLPLPTLEDEEVVKDLGLELFAYQSGGSLELLLVGACEYEVKLAEWFLNKPWNGVSWTKGVPSWSIQTDATGGIFEAIVCSEHLCTPIAIAFEAKIWDGKVPDLSELAPKATPKLQFTDVLYIVGIIFAVAACAFFMAAAFDIRSR